MAAALRKGDALMLLPIESAALAIKDMSPQLKGCIAGLADNRPCIVARANYQDFGSSVSGQQLIAYAFPQLSLVAGRQIRIHLFGTARNASGGAPQTFLPAIRVIQTGAPTQVVGAITTLAASALQSAWRIDATVTVSIPAAQGQYTPGLGASTGNASVSVYASMQQPNEAIMIGGILSMDISDTTLTGALVAGGIVKATTPGSFLLSSVNPNNTVLVNSVPTQIYVDISTGANTSLVLVGGYMEAL
jgi:hypothetical protein